VRFVVALVLALVLDPRGALAASEIDAVYRDRTVRVIVGFAPGGGFDVYSRLLARHLGRHLPGTPAVIVENMPGAGSLIAANHLFNVAKPDGLTIGHFIGRLLLGQVLGQPGILFDARRFEYIGTPITDHIVCAFTRASGITSLEKLKAA
jgi:tripartite-type tricarboxylate transporter receptor subunit TctC